MFHYIIKCFQWANLTRLLNIGDYIPRQRSFILLFLAVFTICLYCNVKFSLAFDEAPKFSGGAFNHVNRSAESWEITFIPPGAYNGIYAFECSKDFTSKSSGGICKNFSLFEFSGDNAIDVYVQAKSEKIFSFGVTHYLRCLRQAFFHKSECLLPLGQAQ